MPQKKWPYIINTMWLLIQSCSIYVRQDCVFYIPFYLVTEATAWFLVPRFPPPPFPLHFLNNLKVGHGGSLMYTHTPLFPSKPEQKCHTGGSVGEIKEGEHTAADCFISFTPGRRGSAWLGEGCWGGGGWHWRCCCFSPTVSIIHLRQARQSRSLAVALATHQPEECAIGGLKLCVRDPDRDGSPGKK